MIAMQTTVLLQEGLELTAAEVFEAVLHLADRTSPFPIMTELDKQMACVHLLFQILEWEKDEKEKISLG